jgi:hypothetical protein
MTTLSWLKPNQSAAAGAILLLVPCSFIGASLLKRGVPGLVLLASPIILLGTLLAAVALNGLSITSINLKTDAPSVVTVSVALRLWNLAVICVAGVLLAALLGYAFIENFQLRPNG